MDTPALRVLVADDQSEVRESICEMLDAHGYIVCAAVATGEDAVEQASRQHPDIVLMDINMPGMGGIEAARIIRGLPRPAPVLFLTALSDRSIAAKAAESGGLGYLVKPFHSRQLAPMIQTAVQRFQELAQAHTVPGPAPEATARPALDQLTVRARGSGLDAAAAEFLGTVGAQLKGRGAAICIFDPGSETPAVPAQWGDVPPLGAPVWRLPAGAVDDAACQALERSLREDTVAIQAPFRDSGGMPAGSLVLFGAPSRRLSAQDGDLLKVYASGLGDVLSALRIQQPLAWRLWVQAGRATRVP